MMNNNTTTSSNTPQQNAMFNSMVFAVFADFRVASASQLQKFVTIRIDDDVNKFEEHHEANFDNAFSVLLTLSSYDLNQVLAMMLQWKPDIEISDIMRTAMESKQLVEYGQTFNRRKNLAVDYILSLCTSKLLQLYSGHNVSDEVMAAVVDRCLEQLKIFHLETSSLQNQRRRICDKWSSVLYSMAKHKSDYIRSRLFAEVKLCLEQHHSTGKADAVCVLRGLHSFQLLFDSPAAASVSTSLVSRLLELLALAKSRLELKHVICEQLSSLLWPLCEEQHQGMSYNHSMDREHQMEWDAVLNLLLTRAFKLAKKGKHHAAAWPLVCCVLSCVCDQELYQRHSGHVFEVLFKLCREGLKEKDSFKRAVVFLSCLKRFLRVWLRKHKANPNASAKNLLDLLQAVSNHVILRPAKKHSQSSPGSMVVEAALIDLVIVIASSQLEFCLHNVIFELLSKEDAASLEHTCIGIGALIRLVVPMMKKTSEMNPTTTTVDVTLYCPPSWWIDDDVNAALHIPSSSLQRHAAAMTQSLGHVFSYLHSTCGSHLMTVEAAVANKDHRTMLHRSLALVLRCFPYLLPAQISMNELLPILASFTLHSSQEVRVEVEAALNRILISEVSSRSNLIRSCAMVTSSIPDAQEQAYIHSLSLLLSLMQQWTGTVSKELEDNHLQAAIPDCNAAVISDVLSRCVEPVGLVAMVTFAPNVRLLGYRLLEAARDVHRLYFNNQVCALDILEEGLADVLVRCYHDSWNNAIRLHGDPNPPSFGETSLLMLLHRSGNQDQMRWLRCVVELLKTLHILKPQTCTEVWFMSLQRSNQLLSSVVYHPNSAVMASDTIDVVSHTWRNYLVTAAAVAPASSISNNNNNNNPMNNNFNSASSNTTTGPNLNLHSASLSSSSSASALPLNVCTSVGSSSIQGNFNSTGALSSTSSLSSTSRPSNATGLPPPSSTTTMNAAASTSTSSKDFFINVAAYLQSDVEMRRIASQLALGRVNIGAMEDLSSVLGPIEEELYLESKGIGLVARGRKKEDRDLVRLQLGNINRHICELMRVGSLQECPSLRNRLVRFLEESASFLVAPGNDQILELWPLKFSLAVVARVVCDELSCQETHDALPTELRRQLFHLFGSWCSVGPLSRSTDRDSKAIDETVKKLPAGAKRKPFEDNLRQQMQATQASALGAMAALLQGNLWSESALQLPDGAVITWINGCLEHSDKLIRRVGRSALENLTAHNQQLVCKLSASVAVTGSAKVASGHFLVLSDAIALSMVRLGMPETLNMILLKVADPSKRVRAAAMQLLNVFINHNNTDGGSNDSNALNSGNTNHANNNMNNSNSNNAETSFLFSASTTTPESFGHQQVVIAEKLAQAYMDWTLPVVHEIVTSIRLVNGHHEQGGMLRYVAPWLRNIDLSKEQDSVRANIIQRLLQLTAVHAEQHPEAINGLWQAVAFNAANVEMCVEHMSMAGVELLNEDSPTHHEELATMKRVAFFLSMADPRSVIAQLVLQLQPTVMTSWLDASSQGNATRQKASDNIYNMKAVDEAQAEGVGNNKVSNNNFPSVSSSTTTTTTTNTTNTTSTSSSSEGAHHQQPQPQPQQQQQQESKNVRPGNARGHHRRSAPLSSDNAMAVESSSSLSSSTTAVPLAASISGTVVISSTASGYSYTGTAATNTNPPPQQQQGSHGNIHHRRHRTNRSAGRRFHFEVSDKSFSPLDITLVLMVEATSCQHKAEDLWTHLPTMLHASLIGLARSQKEIGEHSQLLVRNIVNSLAVRAAALTQQSPNVLYRAAIEPFDEHVVQLSHGRDVMKLLDPNTTTNNNNNSSSSNNNNNHYSSLPGQVADMLIQALDTDDCQLRQGWGAMALHWAIHCPIRPWAHISHEIYRGLKCKATANEVLMLLVSLGDAITEPTPLGVCFAVDTLDSLECSLIDLRPNKLILVPQVFWCCVSLLRSPFIPIFAAAMGIIQSFLRDLDWGDPLVSNVMLAVLPKQWDEFQGIQPLLTRGLTIEQTLGKTLEILASCLRLHLRHDMDFFDTTAFRYLTTLFAFLPYIVCHINSPPTISYYCKLLSQLSSLWGQAKLSQIFLELHQGSANQIQPETVLSNIVEGLFLYISSISNSRLYHCIVKTLIPQLIRTNESHQLAVLSVVHAVLQHHYRLPHPSIVMPTSSFHNIFNGVMPFMKVPAHNSQQSSLSSRLCKDALAVIDLLSKISRSEAHTSSSNNGNNGDNSNSKPPPFIDAKKQRRSSVAIFDIDPTKATVKTLRAFHQVLENCPTAANTSSLSIKRSRQSLTSTLRAAEIEQFYAQELLLERDKSSSKTNRSTEAEAEAAEIKLQQLLRQYEEKDIEADDQEQNGQNNSGFGDMMLDSTFRICDGDLMIYPE